MTPQQSEGWVRERTEGPVRLELFAQRIHAPEYQAGAFQDPLSPLMIGDAPHSLQENSPRQEATSVRNCRMVLKHWSLLTALTAFVPCDPSLWCFLLASRGDSRLTPSTLDIGALIIQRGITGLRVYDGDVHQLLVSLPRHLRRPMA